MTLKATKKRQLEYEAELIERARKDPVAFGKLYDHYYADILNYVVRRTANVSLSQDLVANTFSKAMQRLWQFQWRGLPFSAWLYRIASNEVNQYFRIHKQFRTKPVEVLDNVPGYAASSAEQEIIEQEEKLQQDVFFVELHKAISELKAHYQEVIVLRYFEKMKVAEIARITGRREGTVKSLIHRGLGQLRMRLEKENGL